jgi:hypothetical protein
MVRFTGFAAALLITTTAAEHAGTRYPPRSNASTHRAKGDRRIIVFSVHLRGLRDIDF